MSLKGPQALAAADLPQLERLVIASRQSVAAVRTEEDGSDRPRVSFERPQAVAAADLPQLQRVVPASRQGVAAVRTEEDGSDVAHVSFEGPQQPARGWQQLFRPSQNPLHFRPLGIFRSQLLHAPIAASQSSLSNSTCAAKIA